MASRDTVSASVKLRNHIALTQRDASDGEASVRLGSLDASDAAMLALGFTSIWSAKAVYCS